MIGMLRDPLQRPEHGALSLAISGQIVQYLSGVRPFHFTAVRFMLSSSWRYIHVPS
jgi:hypothetical protein